MLRSMIYTIAKTNVRTQNMGPYIWVISRTNHVCHRTNKHGIWHNEHFKTRHAKNQQCEKHVNINEE